MRTRYVIYFDGASRGNPGHSGVGAIVLLDKEIFSVLSKYVGITTNNYAEYLALREILFKIEPLIKEKDETEILLRTDSELVAKQLSGIYRIKNPQLKGLSVTIMKVLRRYWKWSIEHIPREENKVADMLASAAVDNALKALNSKHKTG